MNQPLDLDLFRRRLAETIAWCSPRASVADPKHSLRTVELLPDSVRNRAAPGLCDNYYRESRQLRAIFEAVADERAMRLRQEGEYPSDFAGDVGSGNLLVCVPNESVLDGVSEPESHGFFDSDDISPWDTWVYCMLSVVTGRNEPPYPTAHLISWVPAQLAGPVQQGIDINPVDCIFWAADRSGWTDSEKAFLRQLEPAGLLGSVPPHPD